MSVFKSVFLVPVVLWGASGDVGKGKMHKLSCMQLSKYKNVIG